MTELNNTIRNVMIRAVKWGQARQKLRDLTHRYKDLSDRKSATKDDFTRLKKELDKAQAELVSVADDLEKAVIEFSKTPAKLVAAKGRRPRKPVDLKKVAKTLGVFANAVEQALTPQETPGWKPPPDVIDVEVIDISPKKP